MADQDDESFFSSSAGRGITIALIILIVIGLGWYLKSAVSPSSAAQLASKQLFVCAETGKSFSVTIEPGMKIPVYSPYSKKETGYLAELCYWTADGQPKNDPDPVLMNALIGKKEPTFCPICRRLVVHRNPRAAEGRTPPPTEEEYKARHGSLPSGTSDGSLILR